MKTFLFCFSLFVFSSSFAFTSAKTAEPSNKKVAVENATVAASTNSKSSSIVNATASSSSSLGGRAASSSSPGLGLRFASSSSSSLGGKAASSPSPSLGVRVASNSTSGSAATSAKKSTDTFPNPPKFKDDEYAIFIEDAYQVFKTKKFEKLELSESCFKSTKPHCQAYEFAQIKPKDLSVKVTGLNNKSAIHCEAVGGRNLLALDNKNNQYNFCRFSDGSMVNSWSMNYKHFPPRVIK